MSSPPPASHRGDDRTGELARVERASALLRDPFERLAEVGELQEVARKQAGAVGAAVEAAALVGVAQDQVEDRVQVRLRPGELDAVAGELDRRLQELAPGQPSVARVQRLEPGRRSRHGARSRADPEDLGRLAVPAECRRRLRASVAASGDGRPRPGVATKKSASRGGRRSPGTTSAKPPAPGPVSGLSVTQAANPAATQASTAFPPSSSTRAPAAAVSRCPRRSRRSCDCQFRR